MADLGHVWVDLLKIDIESHEWDLFSEFYATEGASLPATQILVEFHFPGKVAIVWDVFDKLLADNFRIFSVEPNYYCMDGCCAKDLIEFAFIKVAPNGNICSVQKDEVSGSGTVPHGCRPDSQQ